MEFAGGRLVTRIEGALGWLTFNKPDRLNAIDLDMWLALPDAVASLAKAPGVRVIIAMGAGDRAFASGADIEEFDQVRFDAKSNHTFTHAVSLATGSLLECDKPVIAMIRGFCIGGGVVIASACDIRICTEDAQFGVPAAKLGLGYELDNYRRLVDLIGAGAAKELVLTARRIDAHTAHRLGLVNQVVAADDLERAARSMAELMLPNAPLTLAAVKASHLAATGGMSSVEAQAAIDACFDSDDFKEGRRAFRAKQTPAFRGE